MQPSWITVPWLQFQSMTNAPTLSPQGQILGSHPSHYPPVNGLTPLSSAVLTTTPQQIFTSVAGLSAHVSMAGLNPSSGGIMSPAGIPNTINGSLSSMNGGLSNSLNGLNMPPCLSALPANGVAGLSLAGLGNLSNPMGSLGAMMALTATVPPNTAPLNPGSMIPLQPRQPGPLSTLLPIKVSQ